MSNWREFRNVKKNKTQVWKVRQLGDSYETLYGQLNGAMQTSGDTPGDKGKPGTKAYVSSADNCHFHLEREVRTKTEHGYVEYINGVPTEETITSITFDKFLPKNFCAYKPKTSIEQKNVEKLYLKKKARLTRKYDGMNHLAVYHSWGWEIYSRRMDLASERFPKHIEFLNTLDFEIGTILDGEMLCSNPDGTDNFKNISRICRSDPPEARKLVEGGEVPEPTYQIFDILFHNGVALNNVSYDNRRKLWANIVGDLIRAVKLENVNHTNWESTAKKNGWEGYVIVDGDSTPGDKFFSFDGDAKRPSGHSKLKPTYSEETIVFAGTQGGGKRLNGIGAVFMKQRHPDTKEWFNCGKCGSGFSEESLEELELLFKKNNLSIVEKDKDADKIDINNDKGIVIEIEYSDRQPGTNKFRFPVFMRVRDDKAAKECFAQRLAPEEE